MGHGKQTENSHKKLQIVLVIALGSNCPGVTIRGQCNSLRWELSGGIFQGAVVLGDNCPGAIVLGGNCPRGNCPEENCPRTV